MKNQRHIVGARLRQTFCLGLALLFCGCHVDRCTTPFGEGGELDLLMPEFFNLYNNPGGTLVINRGYRNTGILVHCMNLGEYVAFGCVCPHCQDQVLQPDDAQRATLLTCPDCGSRFEVYFGNPIEGSQTSCPLFQYNTRYDGRYLSIY